MCNKKWINSGLTWVVALINCLNAVCLIYPVPEDSMVRGRRRRSLFMPQRWYSSNASSMLGLPGSVSKPHIVINRGLSLSVQHSYLQHILPPVGVSMVCWYWISMYYRCLFSTCSPLVIQFFEGSRPDHTKSWLYGVCSLSYLGAMVSSNSALQYVNYPTQVSLIPRCHHHNLLWYFIILISKQPLYCCHRCWGSLVSPSQVGVIIILLLILTPLSTPEYVINKSYAAFGLVTSAGLRV